MFQLGEETIRRAAPEESNMITFIILIVHHLASATSCVTLSALGTNMRIIAVSETEITRRSLKCQRKGQRSYVLLVFLHRARRGGV